jgi:hypothetical protein
MNPHDDDYEMSFSQALGDDLKEVLSELGEIVFSPRSEKESEIDKHNDAFLRLLDRLRSLTTPR